MKKYRGEVVRWLVSLNTEYEAENKADSLMWLSPTFDSVFDHSVWYPLYAINHNI